MQSTNESLISVKANIGKVISPDNQKYIEILNPKLEASTEMAVCISSIWIPKSQLAIDVDGNLYCSRWFLNNQGIKIKD